MRGFVPLAFLAASSAVPAGAGELTPAWEAQAGLGISRGVGEPQLFGHALDLDLSMARRFGGSRRAFSIAAFSTYRRILNAGDQASFWYLDAGLRPAFWVTPRVSLWVDGGVSLRRIVAPGGTSNMVTGLVVGSGVDVAVFSRPAWELRAALGFRATAHLDTDDFWVGDLSALVKVTRCW